MPWRTPPEARKQGVVPDPYHVWMSEIMLQQTTVAAVRDYFVKFTTRWPNVDALAQAEDADVMAAWAGLGYYARARNLLKCARVISDEYAGVFPSDYKTLLGLPGIGPYTAAAVSSIAFDQPETVLDGNVERVMARWFEVHTPLPKAKPELMAFAETLTPKKRAGDYAQAIMDLGATVCTPRNPACGICPWMDGCKGRLAGTARDLPKKTPKKKIPTRYGVAYVARRNDGAWLLETRPEKGMLGGMLGWPTTEWTDAPEPAAPLDADWAKLDAQALHTFTHFHLQLDILTAVVDLNVQPDRGRFFSESDFRPSDLPTVMRKVFDLGAATLRLD